jgi:hypothetical protein
MGESEGHRECCEERRSKSRPDSINLNAGKTNLHNKFPSTRLECDMARSYRFSKNPDDIQATVYANKEDLPRLNKPSVRQDRMVNKSKASRVNSQSKTQSVLIRKNSHQVSDAVRSGSNFPWTQENAGFFFVGLAVGITSSTQSFRPPRNAVGWILSPRRSETMPPFLHGRDLLVASVGIGILKEQTGNSLSVQQLRYNKNKSEIRTGHVPPPPASGDIPSVGSTAEQCIIRFLEKERQEGNKSYIALYQSVAHSTLLTISWTAATNRRAPRI